MAELEAFVRALDTLEPSIADLPPVKTWRELWVWPAGRSGAGLRHAAAVARCWRDRGGRICRRR
jgi:hypothetical protein